jgi:hypothetical protein
MADEHKPKVYAALYGPHDDDEPRWSRYGFVTKEEAWEYVYSKGCTYMCDQCSSQYNEPVLK